MTGQSEPQGAMAARVDLGSFPQPGVAVVFGAGGGIGAAFVEVWTRLPRWRWAARIASLPGVLITLELGYRIFLPVRPILSRLFGHVLQLQAIIGVGKRK